MPCRAVPPQVTRVLLLDWFRDLAGPAPTVRMELHTEAGAEAETGREEREAPLLAPAPERRGRPGGRGGGGGGGGGAVHGRHGGSGVVELPLTLELWRMYEREVMRM